MAKISKKPDIWKFLQSLRVKKVQNGTSFDTILSFIYRSTKSMWDHMKAKHTLQMTDEKKINKRKSWPQIEAAKDGHCIHSKVQRGK